jgi:hypothetical protein
MQKVFKAGFLVTLLAIFGLGLVMTSTPAQAATNCPVATCGSLSSWTYSSRCLYDLHGCPLSCAVYRHNVTGERCRSTSNCYLI